MALEFASPRGTTRFGRRRALWALRAGTALMALLLGAGVAGVPARATEATPIGSPSEDRAVEPGSLASMLALVPDPLGQPDSPPLLASYADVSAQLAAAGAPASPKNSEDRRAWLRATSALALPAVYGSDITFDQMDAWQAALGFDPMAVEQTLVVGVLGGGTGGELLLRGPFDGAAVRAALRRSGYAPGNGARPEVVSLPEGAEGVGDLSGFGGLLRHAAILPDRTLVFGPTVAGVAAVVDVATGRAPSLGARAQVATLVEAAGTDLVSVEIWSSDDAGAAVREVDVSMPRPELVGIAAGATTPPSLRYALFVGAAAEVREALPLVEERLTRWGAEPSPAEMTTTSREPTTVEEQFPIR